MLLLGKNNYTCKLMMTLEEFNINKICIYILYNCPDSINISFEPIYHSIRVLFELESGCHQSGTSSRQPGILMVKNLY